MRYIRRILVAVVGASTLILGLGVSSLVFSQPETGRTNLEPGLDLGSFSAFKKSPYGDSMIRVLRIDPRSFKFVLLNASQPGQGMRHSVRNWVKQNHLVAGINASMYQKDQMTSVSLMNTLGHVNSSWFSKDRTILAFDPVDKTLPPVRIIDRDCDDFDTLRKKYRTLIQSIRMISCKGENVWQQKQNIWSTAAIGIDRENRILFIHARSPYSTHDLINILLQLPLRLKRAMYVEGGPDAQLYIRSGEKEFGFIGSYSTGSHESNENNIGWPVPNILGVVRSPSAGAIQRKGNE